MGREEWCCSHPFKFGAWKQGALTFVEAFAEGESSVLERVASGGWGFFLGLQQQPLQKTEFQKQKLFWSELCKPYGQHGP